MILAALLRNCINRTLIRTRSAHHTRIRYYIMKFVLNANFYCIGRNVLLTINHIKCTLLRIRDILQRQILLGYHESLEHLNFVIITLPGFHR